MRNCGHQLRDASLNHCAGKAEIDRDPVYLTVAQQTYDLTKQLRRRQIRAQSKLDG